MSIFTDLEALAKEAIDAAEKASPHIDQLAKLAEDRINAEVKALGPRIQEVRDFFRSIVPATSDTTPQAPVSTPETPAPPTPAPVSEAAATPVPAAVPETPAPASAPTGQLPG